MSLTTLIISSVLPEKQIPTAIVKADPAFGIIGSVVKLDGRLSTDPEGSTLTYAWTFDSVPIGSRVESEGFRSIDPDNGIVSFSPDVVGEYVIGLTVSNGMFDSEKAQAVSSIRAILVPHGRGLIPDGKWIWSYIRDVWQGVENKETFETLWSALIQIVGSELLKLYEVDFNKSIRDIQDLFQRRWLSYSPELDIKVNGPDFFLGFHFAGKDASTINLGESGSLIVVNANETFLIEGSLLQDIGNRTLTISSSSNSANNKTYEISGVNSTKNGYKLKGAVPYPTADKTGSALSFEFTAQSLEWTLSSTGGGPSLVPLMAMFGSPLDYLLPIFGSEDISMVNVQVGDVLHYKSGPNKGIYRITEKTPTGIKVDRPPQSFSNSTTNATHKADTYRPLAFKIPSSDTLLTNTVAIPFDPAQDVSKIAPGRIIIVNGVTFTIVRTTLDLNQREPTVIVTVDRALLQSGLSGLSWRTPPTLVSTTQDFDVDGVSSGDRISFDIVQNGKEVTTVFCQVAGVDRGRLGFVPSLAPLVPGQVPSIPDATIFQVASDFGISGAVKSPDGSYSFSGTTQQYLNEISSGQFKTKYWNKQLTPTTDISINPNFQIKPRLIRRCRLIPIDESVRSIPLLQNYVSPTAVVEKDGKFYQQYKSKEYEVEAPPYYLKENIDYVIDGQIALSGDLTFKTGTDIVEADGGDFIDRGIGPGDQFIVREPVTLARTYYVQAVISPTKLKLTREIPLYPLGEYVTANVQVRRRRSGHFIRFTPGKFTAQRPAPERLWSEVTFFDNNENIESNFGILVGLTRADVDAVSENLNYRQAVSGIMYAFLRGSSIERIRLGAQILLGLPFAENRGIIRSIENDYRLDIYGNPVLGRILVEDVDNNGAPLGTLRIYTFPIEQASALAGLETNPATGQMYKVDDIVEKFAILSKGVEISDYLTNPVEVGSFSVERVLQKYHSMRIRINDNIFTLPEIGLVSSFLKKITPSYIAFFVSSVSEFADTVTISDDVTMSVSLGPPMLVDNASLNIPPTMMLESKNPNGFNQLKFGNFPFWVRRTGKDLQTVDGSASITIAAGGIQFPRDTEDFEAPLTVDGDLLQILEGPNAGIYPIQTVTSDSTVTLADAPTEGFEAGVGLRYAIIRPIRQIIRSTVSILTSTGSDIVTASQGLRTDGVSVGDFLTILNDNPTIPSRLQILEVLESTPGSGIWNKLKVDYTFNYTGGGLFAISRSKIVESPYPALFTVSGLAGGKFNAPGTSLLHGLMEPGDVLQAMVGDDVRREYLIIDSKNRITSPPIGNGNIEDVRLVKKNRYTTGVGFGVINTWDPTDIGEVAISESQPLASCTASSNEVTLEYERTVAPASGPDPVDPAALNIRPTDFLKLEGMASGTDIGYGEGIFPIVEVTNSLVKLSVNLPDTESLPWSIIRRS